ncbi:DUF748 domain-containing protein [Marinobacter sp. X15-166B]|uniref:DUF748 domain-containing protein n=1 Tax=Marinobacter sp. X15-166B TaxID=1897620 RepID=UPI0009F6D8F4|nr:DUF748 domain-containing protein [Marinobacter sp. X15-166B]
MSSRKPVYRRPWFWLLLLLLLYTLAGFLLVPWWLQQTLPERIRTHLGWHATLDQVAFNPYAMSVEVSGLAATDANEEPVLHFDRLYVNLDLLQLLRGVVGLGTIELEQPFVRLDLLADQGLNLARDWRVHNPPPARTDGATDTAAGRPRVYVDELAIRDGNMLLRDFSRPEEASFRLQPINLTVSNIATFAQGGEGNDSHYALSAQLGEQSLQWQGSLQLWPLYSAGRLQVSRVSHATIAHFAQTYLPYTLSSGVVTASTDYELLLGDRLSLVTRNGQLSLADLQVAQPDARASLPVLAISALTAEQITFGLQERQLKVESIALDGLDANLVRQTDGGINLLAPIAPVGEAPTPAKGTDDPGAPPGGDGLDWSIGTLELANSRIRWRDEQPASPVTLLFENLNASAGQLGHRLDEPVTYRIEAGLGAGGQLQMQGQLTPQPFTLEAGLSLSQVALTPFEPYLQQRARLGVTRGLLTLDGNLDLDGQPKGLTGTFSGRSEISDLAVTLQGEQTPLLAWQSLQLEPIEYNLAPARLEIGTVTLTGPRAEVVRLSDGAHNVARIPRATPAVAASPQAATLPPAETADPMVFRIGQINLQNGALNYTDTTLSPVFSTRVHELTGSVTGLSNVKPQQGSLAMSGRVGEAGRLQMDGRLGTLGGDGESTLELALTNVSLPGFSPYAGRYLGYTIDSGKLDLGMDYTITGQRLEAGNQVTLERFTLGHPVASEQAVNAPIKLGLALLRNQAGVIQVDLPVAGNLDDPEFRVSRMVTRAFVNLLVKAASSPFSMLGSIVELGGLSADELNSVGFVAGENRLSADETRKLAVLSDALNTRDDLVLNIRGAASPEADGLALKRQRLYRQLGIAGIPADQRVQRLEQVNGDTAGLPAATGERERALVKTLTAEMSLPAEAMGKLARERAHWLQRTLINEYGVSAEQVFVLNPALDARAPAPDRVAVEFSLDVR